jgi:hypothetical protein
MRAARIIMIGVAAFAFGAAGCRTAQQESSSPMFWMYIPAPSIDRLRGAPAEVALPRQPYTTNRIQVLVAGEVVSPGAIRPPQGCTVLQAVGYAGGFTEFAFTRRLRLTRASGQTMDLHLRSRTTGKRGHSLVWYKLGRSRTTDCVLEGGDRVYVPRTVF